jgi:hypothetical protein
MAQSAAELARKFQRSAAQTGPTVRETVTKSAYRTKVIYLAGARTAGLVPGRRMMGVGRRGAAWGVKYDIFETSPGDASTVIKFYGPVHLVNNDTTPHLIEGRGARSARREQARQVISALTGTRVRRARRSSGPQVLSMPWGVRAYAKHPGTRGKNFFRPADDFARSEVKRIVAASRRELLMRGGFKDGGI